MIDLTKLTFEEANKIECALLQLEHYVKDVIESWENISQDKTFSEDFRKTATSNVEWWNEVYRLIYNTERIF